MSRTKKYGFRPGDRERLPEFRDMAIRNAMSTDPMTEDDREAVRAAIGEMCRIAGVEAPPRIVFVPSPFVVRFAGGLAAAIWAIRRKQSATEAATRDATRNATRDATEDATWDATANATEAATLAATLDATEDATRAATRAATEDATWVATANATEAATLAATGAATWAATRAATRAATKWYRLDCNIADLADHVGIGNFGIKCAQSIGSQWIGGNQWSMSIGYIEFFREVAQLDVDWSKWLPWLTISTRCGPMVLNSDFAIVSDRPELLTVDPDNRPHNDSGPFCRWRDGSALYAVHGVRVPWTVVEHRDRLTAADVDREANAEVRRVMLEFLGHDKYIRQSGLKPIHRDVYGELFRREMPDDEPYTVVRVVNSTPEPDGSWRRYVLRVHPELRPVRNGVIVGGPQELTAHNAIASTFGLRGSDYVLDAQS